MTNGSGSAVEALCKAAAGRGIGRRDWGAGCVGVKIFGGGSGWRSAGWECGERADEDWRQDSPVKDATGARLRERASALDESRQGARVGQRGLC